MTMFTGNYDTTSPKVAGDELLGIDPTAVIMAPGLGLLRGILVDQHFLVRHRQNVRDGLLSFDLGSFELAGLLRGQPETFVEHAIAKRHAGFFRL